MAGTHVALIRGINVGKAKRVAMADLRAAVAALGYTDVRTLLNSGNVVFTARGPAARDPGPRVADALLKGCKVTARVMVITAAELDSIVTANPLTGVATNPSRLLIAVLASSALRSKLEPLAKRDWTPEALGLGTRAAYMWCPNLVIGSPVIEAVSRAVVDAMTVRNWGTITRLHALVRA